MQHNQYGSLGMAAVLAAFAFGCASSPAAPFNQMEASNLTAFRLQNYEPPPAAVQAQQPGAVGGLALPPQIQQWIQQGAQGLQQLIPPGLLPQGLLPQAGQPGAAAAQPVVDTTPRFHNFRILGQTQVIDQSLKEELADILGDPDNFNNTGANCMYAEMGLAFGQAQTTNDVLISFSCNQVQGATFPWPHATGTGMKPDTVQKLAAVVQKLFPPGT
jgi:hypothetical protein